MRSSSPLTRRVIPFASSTIWTSKRGGRNAPGSGWALISLHDASMRSAMDAIELVGALVAIDSVNPSLVEGGAGEGAIAAFVASWAAAAGLEAQRLEGTRP